MKINQTKGGNNTMELKTLTDKTLEIFNIKSVSELSKALLDATTRNDFSKYAQFKNLIGDLSVDHMQKIFQYYEADRKEKKQDYTPKSLARLIADLTQTCDERYVIDLCAGTGALTIQKWNTNHNIHFVCVEFDINVIPFLIFNLAIRNIDAIVIHGDVLTAGNYKYYQLTKSKDGFSLVQRCASVDEPYYDAAISNPPYNIKWIEPPFAQLQPRFANCEIPPESNANYAFILTALDKAAKSALILPNDVLTTNGKKEKQIRKYIIENNFVEAVILNPDRMFEATTISTCILVLNRNKTTSDVVFVDMRQSYTIEQREQKGQFGGNSHTNRTYKKEVKTYSDQQICDCIEAVALKKTKAEFSKVSTVNEIIDNDYTLNPSRYIEFQEHQFVHRPFEDIARDINRLEREKSVLKLTINEHLAKQLGLDIDLYTEEQSTQKELESTFETVGCKYEHRKYIVFSKNKNQFTIENQDKEQLSSILRVFLAMWRQHIIYLNETQNIFLAEMRDALLNDLMTGVIDIKGSE